MNSNIETPKMDEASSKIKVEVDRICEILDTMGYLNETRLTNLAFALVREKPDIEIFISYRRAESSLLALYLKSRFIIAGSDAFVDVNNLNLGDDWHSELEDRVKTSTDFICLVGPTTLQSKYVRQEIM